MRTLAFTIETRSGSEFRDIAIAKLIIAGWTGRDKAKMEEHIAELEKLGVKRPPKTPVFYRASAARLTQAPSIEVPGNASSGEIEPLLINDGGRVLLGVASDHTEREVEAYNNCIQANVRQALLFQALANGRGQRSLGPPGIDLADRGKRRAGHLPAWHTLRHACAARSYFSSRARRRGLRAWHSDAVRDLAR
jgi:hypothetical protein